MYLPDVVEGQEGAWASSLAQAFLGKQVIAGPEDPVSFLGGFPVLIPSHFILLPLFNIILSEIRAEHQGTIESHL